MYRTIRFEGFNDREHLLRKITRYSMYSPMFYRSNVFVHSQRVHWIIEELLPYANFPGFDAEKARTLALVHDDAEIITGDIQRGHKNVMTKEQLSQVYENERRAIPLMSQRWPATVNGYSYPVLLAHALDKDCLEAKFVNFADKVDGFGESMHELFAGNRLFAVPALDYTGFLQTFAQNFPELARMFSYEHPFLQAPVNPNVEEILKNGKLHTPEGVQRSTGCAQYDFWRKINLERNAEHLLVTQVETT